MLRGSDADGGSRTTDGRTTAGVLLVTEGIPDALTAAGAGYAAVGILGSQAPDDRVADVLVRHAGSSGRRLVAVVDADAAGRAWGARLGEQLTVRDHPLDVVEPPTGLDLNAWALANPDWRTAFALDLPQRTSGPETKLDPCAAHPLGSPCAP